MKNALTLYPATTLPHYPAARLARSPNATTPWTSKSQPKALQAKAWAPEPSSLSRAELRAIVAEMLG